MRIGAFEIDLLFRETWCLAEIISGSAPLLRSCHIRNVRGNEEDWLRVYARIGNTTTARRSVRGLSPDGESDAAEKGLLNGLRVPSSLRPGHPEGRLFISASGGESAEIPFPAEILSASQIPTDFARAAFLSAYVRLEDPQVREFAAGALSACPPDAEPVSVMRRLYEALLEKHLIYQPVSTTLRADHETVTEPSYVLRSGGSCADLSLLFASLLWQRGLSPVLILYQEHMSVGLLQGENTPGFRVTSHAPSIRSLLDSHALVPLEITGVCTYRHLSFDQALLEGIRHAGDHACCVVHVRECLRSGSVISLTGEHFDRVMTCPVCGYDHLVIEPGMSQTVCPACRETVPVPGSEKPAAPVQDIPAVLTRAVRYARTAKTASVSRLTPGTQGEVCVLPVFEGKPVTRIEAHAFENSHVSQVLLPDSITEIADRAFYGCQNLPGIALPDDLSAIGSAAFAHSGIRQIRIPGSVRRIPRLAFSACTKLTRLEIAEGVETIDEHAFSGCSALASVLLPSSMKTVSRSAFDPACRIEFLSEETRMR